MIRAIKYQLKHNGREREDAFFVRTLLEMQNHNNNNNSNIATKSDTERFGGLTFFRNNYNVTIIKSKATETIGPPLVASGTLPFLTYEIRDAFMTICPEIKMIFPSLHDPSCFGAKPNGEKCKKSICALRDPPRKGGC